MTQKLITQMLAANGIKASGSKFGVDDDHMQLTLLLDTAGGGPVPVPHVESVELHDGFLVAHAGEDCYTLPYASICGLKARVKDGPAGRRAGFL